MSGSKRRSGYRKGVLSAAGEIQEPDETRLLARVVRAAGSNLFEVELAGCLPTTDGAAIDGANIVPATHATQPQDEAAQSSSTSIGLALLPTRFRKLLWIKRGDAVLVSSGAAEGERGTTTTATGEEGRVRFLVEAVLSQDSTKNLKSSGQWPAAWDRPLPPAPVSTAVGSEAPPDAPSPRVGDEAREQGEDEDEAPTIARNRRQQRPRDLPPSDSEEGES